MEFARPMQLRHLRYFVALAHHRHFARAAAECGVSQPTLSAGLAALEQDLGKRLVERDRRFIGLTPQGQAMLPWAQQILGAMGSMAQAVAAIAAPLAGPFRLAAIPAALPLVGRFGDALLHRHPGLHLMVHQATSRAIEQDLQALSCDAGLTYLDHEPPAHVVAVPLAQERYLFVTRRDGGIPARRWIGRRQRPCRCACSTKACSIAGSRCAVCRARPRGGARAVADSYVALLSMVQAGRFATIIPDGYAALLTGLDWAAIRPMAGVETARRLGLVVLDRQPIGPLALAALDVARGLAA
jgi:DNA-binding transcriptional LysR family regulator